MPRYTYTIPRETKGEGRILMIFSNRHRLPLILGATVPTVQVVLRPSPSSLYPAKPASISKMVRQRPWLSSVKASLLSNKSRVPIE